MLSQWPSTPRRSGDGPRERHKRFGVRLALPPHRDRVATPRVLRRCPYSKRNNRAQLNDAAINHLRRLVTGLVLVRFGQSVLAFT
jgi:hypothetical protein